MGRVTPGVGRHRTVDGERLPAPVGRTARGARRRAGDAPRLRHRSTDVARRRPDRVALGLPRRRLLGSRRRARRHVRERAPLPLRPGGGRAVRARAPVGVARPAGHGDARSDPQGRVRARAPDRRSLPARAAGCDRPHPVRPRFHDRDNRSVRDLDQSAVALVVRHVRRRAMPTPRWSGRRSSRRACRPGARS